MKDLTPFEHLFFALLMQAGIGLSTGNWWAGAAFGAGFFIGREHAQYEKHLTHGGNVGGLNPLDGFRVWDWSLDSRLDALFPMLGVVAVAYIVSIL